MTRAIWLVASSGLLAACTTPGSDPPRTAEAAQIHAVFISHNELATAAPAGRICADVYATKPAYVANRTLVKRLADEIARRGLVYHMQSDMDFLRAVAKYDAEPDVTADTGGKNIIAYVASLSPSIITDMHHHDGGPSRGNMADVAKAIRDLGGNEQGIVGGFLAAPVMDSQVDDLLEAARSGLRATSVTDPSFVWRPQILWGGGSLDHRQDLDASGVWRPTSSAAVLTHDPDGPLPNVGTYHGTTDGSGIAELVARARAQTLEPDRLYTVTLIVSQCKLTNAAVDTALARMDAHAQDVADGILAWRTLGETVREWQDVCGGVGFHEQ